MIEDVELWVDGSSQRMGGEMAPVGWAFVVLRDGVELAEGWGVIGPGCTVNDGEYEGLVRGLEWCHERHVWGAKVWSDSLTVVMQVGGAWRCRVARLEVKRREAKWLLDRVGGVLSWAPRYANKADELSRRARHECKW